MALHGPSWEQPSGTARVSGGVLDMEQAGRNQAAIRLLHRWRAGDAREQRATWNCLKRALEADRLSDRPLFPKR